jgi:hypothetical protein
LSVRVSLTVVGAILTLVRSNTSLPEEPATADGVTVVVWPQNVNRLMPGSVAAAAE